MNSKFVYFQSTFLVEYMYVPLFKIGENLIHSTEMIHGDDLLLSLRSIWKLVMGWDKFGLYLGIPMLKISHCPKTLDPFQPKDRLDQFFVPRGSVFGFFCSGQISGRDLTRPITIVNSCYDSRYIDKINQVKKHLAYYPE